MTLRSICTILLGVLILFPAKGVSSQESGPSGLPVRVFLLAGYAGSAKAPHQECVVPQRYATAGATIRVGTGWTWGLSARWFGGIDGKASPVSQTSLCLPDADSSTVSGRDLSSRVPRLSIHLGRELLAGGFGIGPSVGLGLFHESGRWVDQPEASQWQPWVGVSLTFRSLKSPFLFQWESGMHRVPIWRAPPAQAFSSELASEGFSTKWLGLHMLSIGWPVRLFGADSG
jgi:hypothetical protein